MFKVDKTKIGVYAGWERYEHNPVLPMELGETFDATVLKYEDKYRMYFGWRTVRSIAMTESKDGIHWTKPTICISPDPACEWLQEVNRQIVIRKDGKYHMWFNGQTLGDLGSNDGGSYLCYASSDDGIQWDMYPEVIMRADCEWEGYAIMCPHVIWDEEMQMFRLWYSAGEFYEPYALGYATSKDGIHWEKYEGNPVMGPNKSNYWERDRVGANSVFKVEDWYYMTYIGYEDIHKATICMARSRDGIHWERHKDNPIIATGYSGEFDCEAVYKATMAYDEVNDQWKLWYNAGTRGVEYIGMAFKNGKDLNF